jgi:hypothetical protein
MKSFVLVITAFLFFFMTEQAFAGDNLSDAASKIETGILNNLNGLGDTISFVAKETGKIGLNGEAEIRKLLQRNCAAGPYVIDSAFIDSKGIMKIIEPDKYRGYEGSDISKQEAVISMLKIKKTPDGECIPFCRGHKINRYRISCFLKGKAIPWFCQYAG